MKRRIVVLAYGITVTVCHANRWQKAGQADDVHHVYIHALTRQNLHGLVGGLKYETETGYRYFGNQTCVLSPKWGGVGDVFL
jgi:hypothetical protein